VVDVLFVAVELVPGLAILVDICAMVTGGFFVDCDCCASAGVRANGSMRRAIEFWRCIGFPACAWNPLGKEKLLAERGKISHHKGADEGSHTERNPSWIRVLEDCLVRRFP